MSRESIYELIDVVTGEVVGELTATGEVRVDDPDLAARVRAAFGRELLVRDGEVVDELGICFADVVTVRPGDPGHEQTVRTNLGALAGVVPRTRIV